MENKKEIVLETQETKSEEKETMQEKGLKSAVNWKRIKLSKPVEHMGTLVSELDLTGLDDLTLNDMTELYNLYEEFGGTGTVMQESSLLFAELVAQKLTGLTLETLGCLSAKDAIKLKNRLYRFFFMSA